MNKVVSFLKSVFALALGFVLLLAAAVTAVVFAPLLLRIWLGVVGGLGLLILAVRALLLRKDGDKS